MENNKIILYIGGGAMGGVFSGGVLAKLQELNFYENIESIYAGSAGAMNAAYFLSGQTKQGATIYFDDLIHNFILPKNIPLGIAKLVWNKYVHKLPKNETRCAVNIDLAMDLITRQKPLLLDEIKKRSIGFYVKLFNLRTGKIEYLNAKEHDIISVLRAASCCVPYYPFSEKIGDGDYVDGTVPEPIGLQYLLAKYPDRKIVVVVSNFLKRRFRNTLRCFAEGLVGHFCDYPFFKLIYNRERSLRKDIKLALSTPRVLFICPPPECPTIAMTQNRDELIRGFEIGGGMAEKVESFYENEGGSSNAQHENRKIYF